MFIVVEGDVVGCSGDHYDFVPHKNSVGGRYGGSDGDALTFVI